jgi:hypothetical protein
MKTTEELNRQNSNEIIGQCYKSVRLNEITQQTMEILDEKADLHTIVSNCKYVSKEERSALLKLLLKYEDLLDGTLGTWNGPEVEIKLKKNAIPYFS